MRRPTEKRCMPWHASARKTTSHSTSTKPRSLWWIPGDRRENTPPSSLTGHLWNRVSSFKFLGVHITEDLTWSAHTDAVLKKAKQTLFFLRRLRKFGMSPHILHSFYTCTVESILTGCITAWYGNRTSSNRKALQRVVRTVCHTVGGELPSLQDIYTRRCMRKPGGSSVTPAIQTMDCSLCFPQADGYAVSEHAQADWGTAFSLRLSGCWTLWTAHSTPLCPYHSLLTPPPPHFFLPSGLSM